MSDACLFIHVEVLDAITEGFARKVSSFRISSRSIRGVNSPRLASSQNTVGPK
jgi:hypothetical protein